MQFKSKTPSFEYLRKKWIARRRNIQNKFWEKHGTAFKQLAAGSLGGLMLMASPLTKELPSPNPHLSRDDAVSEYDRGVLLSGALTEKLPEEVNPLNADQERNVTEKLSQNFGLNVTAEIDGVRLERNYGVIGGEQHLYRYPGDNLYAHAQTSSDWAKYGEAGIAPGLGAWGYFAPSKGEFTKIDEEKERYYLAVQTFLVSGYAENVNKFRDFFKFRKMIVVNPKTGQSVVAVIGDAGPAAWTGKHLGGSPEVMDALGLAGGPRKGTVLYFFIDDPQDIVPLGPINIRSEA